MSNERRTSNNSIRLMGKVLEELSFNHSIYGEKFYTTKIGIERTSGVFDNIPIMISERIANMKEIKSGDYVEILGEYRSHNTQERKLQLFAFVQKINILKDEVYENEVILTGHICKKPIYRVTPRGSEITETFLAVKRFAPHKTDYIPVLFWGRNAEFVSNFQVGDMLQIFGRSQERIYLKHLEDGSTEKRSAYEISTYKFYVIEK